MTGRARSRAVPAARAVSAAPAHAVAPPSAAGRGRRTAHGRAPARRAGVGALPADPLAARADGPVPAPLAALLTAATGALTRAGTAALRARPPGGPAVWERRNHAGRVVPLCAGPAAALAAAAGAGAVRPAAGAAVLVAGACGAYDDFAGAGDPRRGFRAHLGALRDGEVTSGAVKLFGILRSPRARRWWTGRWTGCSPGS